MSILIKYLLKSLSEKKGRLFLIVFAISISTALLVTALGSADSIINNYNQEMKGAYENFNVVIGSNEKAVDPFFTSSSINMDSVKDSFKMMNIGGYVKSNSKKQFNMIGTTISDFKKFSSIKIFNESNLNVYNGNEIIISQKTSDNLGLKLNREIELCILGKTEKYKIVGITSNNGMFSLDDKDKFSIVAPSETVNSIYGTKDKNNSMYVSIDSNKINSWIKTFNKENLNLTAKLLVDESDVEDQVNTIKIPLLFMLIIVLFMTMFIIYSTFKLIITERMETIGTFLSLGATKFSITILFLKESLIYGIIGGIIGNLFGAVTIYITSFFSNPFKEQGIKATANFKSEYFIIGFILAVLIAMISSILPIISIRKIPVKDVILGTFKNPNKSSWASFIVGLVLLVLSFVFHIIGPNITLPRPYITAIPAFFMGFMGIICIVPKIIEALLYPIVRISRRINGLVMIPINNVRTTKILINNIRLITISIISIIMIMSFSLSLSDLLGGVYKNVNYSVVVSVNSENGSTLKLAQNIINNYNKKTKVTKRQYLSSSLNGNEDKQIKLLLIEPNNYKDYDNYMVYKDKDKQLSDLDNNEDGIIISKRIATRYNLKVNNFINLSVDNKNERFKVLSIVDAKFMNMGNVNLISCKAALKHFGIRDSNEFFISSNFPENKVENDLIKDFKGIDVDISTKQEQMNKDKESSNQIVLLLKIFSYITMIMATFGVVSNVSICFLQRKREMAILSASGLTSRALIVVVESLVVAITALLISFIASVWIIILLQDIFNYLVLSINFIYPINSLGIIAAFSIILMIITCVPVIYKSRNIQIVEELKND
ncbi:ABC transporter permease [Clostridium akagii]|uniref:ABC transporter permease n=1 Tax=Clostridium akagii TaxID=91623 RepID=UPI00047ACBF1|nr:ABC transporter permease [Clostridium akagii]